MKVSIVMKITFGIFGALACILFGQTYNIMGKIVDGGSNPIKGAAVHLLNADKIEFSDENGEFNITDNSPSVKRDSNITQLRNQFDFPVSINRTSSAIFIENAYNIKGALKAVVPHPFSNGAVNFGTVNELFGAPGIAITKTHCGGETYYGKRLTGGGSMAEQVLSGSNSGQTRRGLPKNAASDVLVISALGKNQVKKDMSDFKSDVGSIKLSDNRKAAWHGYSMFKFTHEGKDVNIVLPKTPHPAKPWLWRSTFWEDDPEFDMLMVSKGYHMVYVNVKGMLGNNEAVKIWETFYDIVVNYYRFWPKVVLSGWSRAGLQIFHFAAKNPEKVSVIFADAATCDVKYWPGTGDGNLQKQYGMTKAELENYDENPVDPKILEPMAKANIAIIHETREKDPMDPAKHVDVMAERYKDLGGIYEVIKRPGSKHTDHAAKPEEIEPFITKHNPLP